MRRSTNVANGESVAGDEGEEERGSMSNLLIGSRHCVFRGRQDCQRWGKNPRCDFQPGRAVGVGLVRKSGLEPPFPCGNKLLRLARLPIPPLPHAAIRQAVVRGHPERLSIPVASGFGIGGRSCRRWSRREAPQRCPSGSRCLSRFSRYISLSARSRSCSMVPSSVGEHARIPMLNPSG